MMQSKIFPFQALIILSWMLFSVAELQAQKDEVFFPDTREVILSNDDSVVVAEIKIEEYQPKSIDAAANYYWFKANKIWSNVGGFDGLLLHGEYTVKQLSGKMIRKGRFAEGLKEEIWTEWYDNGNKRKTSTWKEGRLNGKQEAWSEEGQMLSMYTFKKDVKEGKYQLFADGQLAEQGYFRQGVKSGTITTYKAGVLESRIDYRYGKKHGWSRIYDEKGKLVYKQRYLSGELIPKYEKEKKNRAKEKEGESGFKWEFWKKKMEDNQPQQQKKKKPSKKKEKAA